MNKMRSKLRFFFPWVFTYGKSRRFYDKDVCWIRMMIMSWSAHLTVHCTVTKWKLLVKGNRAGKIMIYLLMVEKFVKKELLKKALMKAGWMLENLLCFHWGEETTLVWFIVPYISLS